MFVAHQLNSETKWLTKQSACTGCSVFAGSRSTTRATSWNISCRSLVVGATGIGGKLWEEMAPAQTKVHTDSDLWCVPDHFDAGSVIFDGLEVDQEVAAEGN